MSIASSGGAGGSVSGACASAAGCCASASASSCAWTCLPRSTRRRAAPASVAAPPPLLLPREGSVLQLLQPRSVLLLLPRQRRAPPRKPLAADIAAVECAGGSSPTRSGCIAMCFSRAAAAASAPYCWLAVRMGADSGRLAALTKKADDGREVGEAPMSVYALAAIVGAAL